MNENQAAERIQELEAQVADLQQKLAEMTAMYEQIRVKRFNERGAGRKKNDAKWQERFNTFCTLYKNRVSETEIEQTMGISRSTFYRFKRYLQEAENKQ